MERNSSIFGEARPREEVLAEREVSPKSVLSGKLQTNSLSLFLSLFCSFFYFLLFHTLTRVMLLFFVSPGHPDRWQEVHTTHRKRSIGRDHK